MKYTKLMQNNDLEEISIYSNYVSHTKDPIKRKIFNYKQLANIFSKLTNLAVLKREYFYIKEDIGSDTILKKFLAFSYLQKTHYVEYNDTKLEEMKDKIKIIEDFITQFYDLTSPVLDKKNPKILWFYPKREYKLFFSNCISNQKYNSYFVDLSVMNKLIQIMAGFTKYEFNHMDHTILAKDDVLNFPSLILANIQLYEKGYLQLSENERGIEVSLSIRPNAPIDPIFTNHSGAIKNLILKVCNDIYEENYTLKDFTQ